jgi:hypothetical protein
MCKTIFAIWHSFYFAISPFSFYKFLMLLWHSFANSWDLKIYFLKGIVELEDMKHGGVAPQINADCPIKCGNVEICRVRQSSGFICFRLQLISI